MQNGRSIIEMIIVLGLKLSFFYGAPGRLRKEKQFGKLFFGVKQ